MTCVDIRARRGIVTMSSGEPGTPCWPKALSAHSLGRFEVRDAIPLGVSPGFR